MLTPQVCDGTRSRGAHRAFHGCRVHPSSKTLKRLRIEWEEGGRKMWCCSSSFRRALVVPRQHYSSEVHENGVPDDSCGQQVRIRYSSVTPETGSQPNAFFNAVSRAPPLTVWRSVGWRGLLALISGLDVRTPGEAMPPGSSQHVPVDNFERRRQSGLVKSCSLSRRT